MTSHRRQRRRKGRGPVIVNRGQVTVLARTPLPCPSETHAPGAQGITVSCTMHEGHHPPHVGAYAGQIIRWES